MKNEWMNVDMCVHLSVRKRESVWLCVKTVNKCVEERVSAYVSFSEPSLKLLWASTSTCVFV